VVSYAVHQSQLYAVKAERLNILTDIIEALLTVENPKTTRLSTIIDEKLKPLFGEFIHEEQIKGTNLTYKNQPAIKINNRAYPITVSVGYLIKELEKAKLRYGNRVQSALNEEFDWKSFSHAVRITHQAIDLLTENNLIFPLPYASYLKQLKSGVISKDAAFSVFKEMTTTLEILIEQNKKTVVEKEDQHHRFNDWLSISLLEYWYN
jgi:hypothetical protein